MNVPLSPHIKAPIEQDDHINVPTLMAARLPEIAPLFGTLFSFIEHGRQLQNTKYVQSLETRHARARAEQRKHTQTHDELTHDLAHTPKKAKARRRKLEQRLKGLKASTLTQGMQLALLCGCEDEHVVLQADHVLGLSPLPTGETLTFKGAKVRHGKIAFRLTLDEEVRSDMLGLQVTQSVPHTFRGIPALYSALHGLAYAHSTTHGLPDGTCFYARARDDGTLLNPGLVLEQRGYARGDQGAGKLMRLQIELLKRITVSGEHGGHTFDEVPLLVEHQAHYDAHELPEGVRAGTWSTLTIPRELWTLQRELFAQIPKVLLTSHDLYAVNLGLTLKAQEAYAGGHERVMETGHALQLSRLMDQAGLRQPFRAHTSRDGHLLATSLGALEAMGFVTGITTKDLERLESEEIPVQMMLPLESVTPADVHIEPSRPPRPPRRRYRSALRHRTIHVHLYQRAYPDPSDEGAPAPAQGVLLSSG
jgi:hypothetical protein